jgi:hypothetical protein
LTKRCNEIPFTHIYEWKRHSLSLGSVGASGWIVVVAAVAVGFASMIYLLPLFFESDYESMFAIFL